ncbi:flavin reductase family protein [Novosphingobium sp.]|jgi:flavin reductase (DIM6/NTAB) family NADH-FMN oxidoreductase RutF|uniref:flavin reductase family protein n=1 Tax=Novosphingobium sp. TaxID=1874826 RepID=UPI0022BE8029|nr:flavin reductase family protein [Novosphingobium sp.]MCZ8018665.1 flavin reductase family protein [Novosphingobium sp.]MCZ8034670.1 flavin reductase family protein [Novosphingobium sp.]MCZ8052805.1 flavin reductase family protein [Novosphingobium sp.]MCZ8060563.1 flavin reductase family protein [Novosphingobium sp.]MCZ8230589.1 flavin reductase family protein [Novosphingobium sp.]
MIDPTNFRCAMGAYPTGVCIIAAQGADGSKHAMVVVSFTSISLNPPLIELT